MKRPSRCAFYLLAATLALAAPGDLCAQHPIEFVEKFALAADREAVLKELIPGTEDYFFYHALQLQNTGKHAELDTLLGQWAKIAPTSALLLEIRHREALITYDTAPQATLDYLKRTLNASFNHQQDTLHPKPNLPTQLDAHLLDLPVFREKALKDPYSLDGSRVTDLGLEYLLAYKNLLSDQQRRVLLSRVTWPDLPNLVETILEDMRHRDSRGFGEFPIEENLLLEQMEQLRKAMPGLMRQSKFVHAWMARLYPAAEVDVQSDLKARDQWLDTLWDFAKDLDPTFISLKAHLLYLRLEDDEKEGVADQARFLQYLKLPRRLAYVSKRYRENNDVFRYVVNLGEDCSSITKHEPITDDEPLVRRYLLRFLKDSPDGAAFAPYIEAEYLQRVQAEAKLLAGVGKVDDWFAQLSPGEVQALRERVDLDFDTANPETYAPADEVTLALHLKNVPHLAVNLFEINTENFHRSHQQPIGTDLDLDGLVANKHLSFDYTEAPILRVKRSFTLTDLPKRRGVWVADFIGNGRSSRALIRKGQLHYVIRASSAGTAITVLDEARKPLAHAYALIARQRFEANSHQEIVIPFSVSSSQGVILGDGEGFTQYEDIALASEEYALSAGFHVARESLLAGKKATVAVRPTLTMNGNPVEPRLLEDVKLTITATTYDKIGSSTVKDHLSLERNRELVEEFSVPERLAGLHFQLEAKVQGLATGEKIPLTASRDIQINQKAVSDLTSDLFLSNVDGNFIIQELGRTGEPRAERALTVKFWRAEFAEPVEVALKTDAGGAVRLGPLPGIQRIKAKGASGDSRTWELPVDQATVPGNIHVTAGEPIMLPWLEGAAPPVPPMVSLIELRQKLKAHSLTDENHVRIQGAFLVITNLAPGDYHLRYGSQRQEVNIRVTQGAKIAGWLIGDTRHLEARPSKPLQIAAVSTDAEALTLLLENVTPDTRVHVLASRFLPPFNVFTDLGQAPEPELLMSTPDRLHSLYVSGRTLGEEYRYVMERRTAKKFPGVMLPRPGLILNPWVLKTTHTATSEARAGDEFRRARDGDSASMAPAPPRAPSLVERETQLREESAVQEGVSDVDFLANTGLTSWNLKPGAGGKISVKLSDVGDRQFVRILAVNAGGSVMRDISLPDAKTRVRDLTLRNGLDPVGHFTRQNQTTTLEKDVPFTIKDGSTAQFETVGSLGDVYSLFRTLSNDPRLAEFSFILEWPKFDEVKKRSLYSRYACHELNFFLQRRDPAFFKAVVQPYLQHKRDKTFLDHYLTGADLHPYLRPWSYGRLNIVERILLAQRQSEEAATMRREAGELESLLPRNPERDLQLFESVLSGRSLTLRGLEAIGSVGNARVLLEAAKQRAAGAGIMPQSVNGLIAAPMPAAAAPAPPDPFAKPEAGTTPTMRAHMLNMVSDGGEDKTKRLQRRKAAPPGNAPAPSTLASGDQDANGFANVVNSGRYYTDKSQRIIIPHLQLMGSTLEEAIEFLRAQSRELDTVERDPSKKGVNIIIRNAEANTARITLDLRDVPLGEALRYVTELAGVKYKVEPYAIIVLPVSDFSNELFTRSYKVPPDFLGPLKPGTTELKFAIEALTAAGISFPEGASAVYQAETSKLIVKTTQPNLDRVEALVESLGGKGEGLSMEADLALRESVTQQFYHKLEPTSEWAENNYYKLPIEQEVAQLISINRFWKDYATWDGKGGFLSPHIAEAAGSFAEQMFVLSVLDLPFPAQAQEPKAEVKDLSLTITPAQRFVLFHRELKPAEIDKAAPRLLVSQNFYRNGDRYLQQGGEKQDKFITDEFLTGVVYGCQIVVTNPTSSTQKLDLLVQIPQGAIPVLGSKATDNRPLTLESYRTFTMDYFFYFPHEGKFAQHPVHVSKAEKVVAFALPFTFNVVNELTKLDTASWDYVSQFGKAEDVLAYLEQHNLRQTNLDRMAWRLRDVDFFRKAVALLAKNHVYHNTTWSYALVHNDADALREYLLHADTFLDQCGPALECKLLTLDPVSRHRYQHLEYSPLVNARAHQLGSQRTVLNDAFFQQYEAFLNLLAHRPGLQDEDRLAVSYYLLLQDRSEEGLAEFDSVDAAKIAERLQYDYMKAVASLYRGDVATARQLATAHQGEAVDRWRDKFVELLGQLREMEGGQAAPVKPDNREQVQNRLASTEPSLDFKVENKEVRLAYQNLKEVTVNYYPMDLEFLFSTAPFASQNSARFGMIQPNRTEHLQLPAGSDTHSFILPKEYHSSNVLVEVVAGGKTVSHAYYANELNVQISESYGRLQVLHATDRRPLPKAYVKVFADVNGVSQFYKDGYTDLRGKFDYLSLSTSDLDNATRFSILIMSDEFGAAVREVKPPQQ